ncbi:MAG: hypothetical protein IJF02_05955 [Oscillospiraceae bacterium]|nr:hypothetical protein [Oscillospiraceae bacterium]
MNINRYLKKKSPLPIIALVLPCIPVVIAIVHSSFMLYAKSMGDILTMFSIAVIMITSQAVALPICGGAGLLCAILALRKLGRKKRIIAAIIWNGLWLLLSLPLIYVHLVAL